MKIIFILLCCPFFTLQVVHSQIIVGESFTNRSVIRQDSFVVISNLGKPFNQNDQFGQIFVTSEFIPFTVNKPDTTGINFIGTLEGLKIYPNPVPKVVVMERENVKEQYYIRVFQLDGKLIQKLTWTEGIPMFQLSLEGYPAGMYVFAISDKSSTHRSTFRIIRN